MTNDLTKKTWNQRLFTVLWVWLSLRTMLPWLVFFRLTFEGNSYSWGTEYFGHMFHSSGLARPDFLLVYLLLAAGLYLLYLMRNHNLRLAAPLLVGFLGIFAADAAFQLVSGEPMIFEGATLDVKVDLTSIFFVLQFGMFALALWWWRGCANAALVTGSGTMTAHKATVVKVCLAFVPAQLALLIFGEPHGLTDEIGVIGTLLQFALFSWAFYPGANYRALA